MGRGRLEAFSDGVLAIIITIMVLELKTPTGPTLGALRPFAPVFASYVLSFVFVGIYWSNHHHMMHLVHRVNGLVLWANLHLLFWLSLIPVVTAWVGANPSASGPAACYGVVLFMSGVAYLMLQRSLVTLHGEGGELHKAIGRDAKGKISAVLYAAGIGLAFLSPFVADALYTIVAIVWFVPDRRVERVVDGQESGHESPPAA